MKKIIEDRIKELEAEKEKTNSQRQVWVDELVNDPDIDFDEWNSGHKEEMLALRAKREDLKDRLFELKGFRLPEDKEALIKFFNIRLVELHHMIKKYPVKAAGIDEIEKMLQKIKEF